MYTSFDLPSVGKFEFGNNGHVAWERSVALGPRLVPASAVGSWLGPNPDEILKWTNAGLELETLSTEQVNGSPCYLVSMSARQERKPASTACFDVKTGYLVKTTLTAGNQAGDVTVDSVFSDYRPHEGLEIAHHLETKIAGTPAIVDLKEITLNTPIPDAIFDLPADVRALEQRHQDQLKNKDSDSAERPTLRRRPSH
jgi:hypothetical protein